MSGEKTKKSIFKKWWFWAIIIVIGIAVVGSGGEDTSQTTAPASSNNTQTEQPKEEVKNKPTMSKAEFDQLKSGMTYEEATEIIGGPGEVASESGNKGDQYHTVMYQYEGEGSLGANANLMFQGNKLQNKAQFGLE